MTPSPAWSAWVSPTPETHREPDARVIHAVKADCTLGEISAALEGVFGTYREPVPCSRRPLNRALRRNQYRRPRRTQVAGQRVAPGSRRRPRVALPQEDGEVDGVGGGDEIGVDGLDGDGADEAIARACRSGG